MGFNSAFKGLITQTFHCNLLMLTLLLSLGAGILCCVAKGSEVHYASIYKVYMNGVIKIQYTLQFENGDTMFL